MNRRIKWCLGLILWIPVACERTSEGEPNEAISKPSQGATQPSGTVEEVPVRAEEERRSVPAPEVDAPAKKMEESWSVAALKREAVLLRNDIDEIERQLSSASATEAWMEKLKDLQKIVREADARVGALQDVRNPQMYSKEIRTAADGLRSARQSVNKFRTEIKMSMESQESGPQEEKLQDEMAR